MVTTPVQQVPTAPANEKRGSGAFGGASGIQFNHRILTSAATKQNQQSNHKPVVGNGATSA